MFVKKGMCAVGIFLFALVAEAKTPSTEKVVSRPQTAAAVTRPATQVPVLKPVSTTTVNQLKTEVVVSHPQTNISVTHPSTVKLSDGGSAPGGADQKSSKNTPEKAVNSVPSSSSATTMSGFQMPKAKDFKAANLTKGDDGLGKPNDSEKNASAVAFQVPKADEASAENLKSIAEKAQSLNKATLEKQIEGKTSK